MLGIPKRRRKAELVTISTKHSALKIYAKGVRKRLHINAIERLEDGSI